MDIAIDPIVEKAKSFQLKSALVWAAQLGLCAVILALVLFKAWHLEHPLQQASAYVLSFGVLLVGVYYYLKGRTQRLPDPSVDTRAFIRAHRKQLTLHAKLNRTALVWVLAPLSVGMCGFVAAKTFTATSPGALWGQALAIVIAMFAFFAVVGAIGLRRARQLEDQASKLPLDE